MSDKAQVCQTPGVILLGFFTPLSHPVKILEKSHLQASLLALQESHSLRHACGFALADQGADTRLIRDYLGHQYIQHTVRYTATNPARFERLWW